MKKMTKILGVLCLVSALAVGLTACGGTGSDSEATKAPAASAAASTKAPASTAAADSTKAPAASAAASTKAPASTAAATAAAK